MFDSALVYVLLLVAIALGWTLGYRFATQSKKIDYPDWIPSVDYILAQSNDASLEKLLNVDQLDADSMDLFLKLGRSLREKGEIDRAMHLHQRLFARADLERSAVYAIQLELALDYSSAGLLDRAERILRELIDNKGYGQEAAGRHLVEILEEEGEWQDILDLHQNKKLATTPFMATRVSHAACELAEKSLKRGDYLEAQNLCRRSLKIDHRCARAYVVMGDLAFGQEEYSETIRCYLKAAELDQQSVIRMLDRLVKAFKGVEDSKGLQEHLRKQWENTKYVPALVAWVEGIVADSDQSDAVNRVLSELSASPSNQGFLALAELVVNHRQQLDKSQLMVVYDILRRIVASEPKYICSHCGFKAKEPHWRCPSCKNWSTVKAFIPQPPMNKLDM